MAKLRFKEDEEGKPSKEAISMFSKDGEMVDFSKPRMCVGQVETWLGLLLETMQETIKHEFNEAVITYEDKPREQWIFEPPAQVSTSTTCVSMYVCVCVCVCVCVSGGSGGESSVVDHRGKPGLQQAGGRL